MSVRRSLRNSILSISTCRFPTCKKLDDNDDDDESLYSSRLVAQISLAVSSEHDNVVTHDSRPEHRGGNLSHLPDVSRSRILAHGDVRNPGVSCYLDIPV